MAGLASELERAHARIAELEARLGRDSTNSLSPPSADSIAAKALPAAAAAVRLREDEHRGAAVRGGRERGVRAERQRRGDPAGQRGQCAPGADRDVDGGPAGHPGVNGVRRLRLERFAQRLGTAGFDEAMTTALRAQDVLRPPLTRSVKTPTPTVSRWPGPRTRSRCAPLMRGWCGAPRRLPIQELPRGSGRAGGLRRLPGQ